MLIEGFDALFFDAYGVLVDQAGALPGAASLIAHLHQIGKPYFILTNDASKLPQTAAERFQGLGLAIGEEHIIASGCLLKPYFAQHRLQGARCVVLGTEDSRCYVKHAGGKIVEPTEEQTQVVVICDEEGYPFLPTLDAVLSLLFRRLDAQEPVALLLPNPDLVYPKGHGQYGIAAGSMAALLEHALASRYPEREALRFIPLGKPHAAIFEEAMRRLKGTDAPSRPSDRQRVVMIGDQLETDIRGAYDFGMPSALINSGLARRGQVAKGRIRPTYFVPTLW
jgi:HAD superfamily hydrolase (TIGR01450 family)